MFLFTIASIWLTLFNFHCLVWNLTTGRKRFFLATACILVFSVVCDKLIYNGLCGCIYFCSWHRTLIMVNGWKILSNTLCFFPNFWLSTQKGTALHNVLCVNIQLVCTAGEAFSANLLLSFNVCLAGGKPCILYPALSTPTQKIPWDYHEKGWCFHKMFMRNG